MAVGDTSNMALLSKGKFSNRIGRDVKCYSCQGFGHIAKDCKTKFCNYCKREGHVITECHRRPQNRKTAPHALAVPASQVSAGHSQANSGQGQEPTRTHHS